MTKHNGSKKYTDEIAKNTGGRAFPNDQRLDYHKKCDTCGTKVDFTNVPDPGMTLRDYFAGQALAGLLGDPNSIRLAKSPEAAERKHKETVLRISFASYEYADAMIAERNKE